jgi:hypothetical protein
VNKAELITWIATLPEDDPRLDAVDKVRRGADPAPAEPLLSLKELAAALGFKHYTSIARLKVQTVGESLGGGRLRYRRSVAEAYLRSPECLAVREELRQARREQEGRRA